MLHKSTYTEAAGISNRAEIAALSPEEAHEDIAEIWRFSFRTDQEAKSQTCEHVGRVMRAIATFSEHGKLSKCYHVLGEALRRHVFHDQFYL